MSLQKTFTEEEKQDIIYKYTIEKMGSKKIGQIYNCSGPTIMKNIKNWGIIPNTKKLNLTGQIFGELTVISPAAARNDKYTRWICKCSCGKQIEVRTDYLTSKHTTSCGHIKSDFFKQKDLIGQRFGKLIVIDNLFNKGTKKCKCDCGNIVEVQTYNLINGNTQSCGCLKSKGELKINTLLTEMKISFKTQYSFDDCRFPDTQRLAYFDYAIFHNEQLICLIEFDGMQHYTGWRQKQESLEEIQKKDNFKNKYCKQHNIPLVRIPYWDLDKIDEKYLLNKINLAAEPDIEEAQEFESDE